MSKVLVFSRFLHGLICLPQDPPRPFRFNRPFNSSLTSPQKTSKALPYSKENEPTSNEPPHTLAIPTCTPTLCQKHDGSSKGLWDKHRELAKRTPLSPALQLGCYFCSTPSCLTGRQKKESEAPIGPNIKVAKRSPLIIQGLTPPEWFWKRETIQAPTR